MWAEEPGKVLKLLDLQEALNVDQKIVSFSPEKLSQQTGDVQWTELP